MSYHQPFIGSQNLFTIKNNNNNSSNNNNSNPSSSSIFSTPVSNSGIFNSNVGNNQIMGGGRGNGGSEFDSSIYHKCPDHGLPVILYCDNCKGVVCQTCVATTHKGHTFEEYKNIVSSTKESILPEMENRVQELWRISKDCTEKLKSFRDTRKEIHNYFEQLHITLMTEERKLTRAIDEEQEKALKYLNYMMEEFNTVLDLLFMSKDLAGEPTMKAEGETVTYIEPQSYVMRQPTTKSNLQAANNNSMDTTRDVKYVSSVLKDMDIESFRIDVHNFNNLEEFISQHISDVQFRKFEHFHVQQLYSKYKEEFKRKPPLEQVRFKFQVHDPHLARTMNVMRESYELIVNEMEVETDYKKRYIEENTLSYIYVCCGMEGTNHLNEVSRFDFESKRWGVVEPTRMKRACSSASVVSTNDHIYIFGGNDTLGNYERMNLATGKWDALEEIKTKGGSSLAAVYDGGRYIYLVGGIQNFKTLDRIDRFDVLTGRCVPFGRLKRPRYYCFACYKDGYVYIVGGTHKEGNAPYTMVNDIESFSVVDGTSKQIFSFDQSNSRVEGFCFDKREFIYFMTSSVFCRFSILTHKVEALKAVPIREGKFGVSLVFGFDEGIEKIFLIGGKDKSYSVYHVATNEWFEFAKKQTYTYFHGSVAVTKQPIYETNSSTSSSSSSSTSSMSSMSTTTPTHSPTNPTSSNSLVTANSLPIQPSPVGYSSQAHPHSIAFMPKR